MSMIKKLRKEAQVALPNSGETYIAEDGTVSMVLDDHHDGNYEPTEQEIKEYAEWLGMSFPEDEELLWIATEGLKAPLPKEWKPCKTDTGEVYYFNFKTGDSIWDHPMDEHFKSKFKTEKERLKKVKEGGAVYDPLSKLPSRTNIIFTDQGVMKHDAPPSPAVTTPRSDAKSLSASQEDKSTIGTPRGVTSTTTPTAAVAAASSKAATTTPTSTPVKRDDQASKPIPSALSASATFSTAISNVVATAGATPRSTTAQEQDAVPESPRLVSEAEKILQDRVKQEAEAEHKQLVESMETKFSEASAALRRTHDDELTETKRQMTVSKRNQISKIEDRLQEELEQQQRNVDQRAKRDIHRQEEELEHVRERIRDVQSSSSQRVEREKVEIEQRAVGAVAQKVREIESEIASIRMRHAKAQMDAMEQEQQRLEIELNRASVDANEKVSLDYEAKSQQLRQQHSATITRLREDAQREMGDEAQRHASAHNGNHEAMIQELKRKETQEVAEIQKQSKDEVQSIRNAEEQRRAAYRLETESTISLILRQASTSQTVSPEVAQQLAAMDADGESRIRALNDQFCADLQSWKTHASTLREQQLQSMACKDDGSSSNPATEAAAAFARETTALLADAERKYRQEEEALQASLERETKAAATDNFQAALSNAISTEFDLFVQSQMRERSLEEAKFQESKRLAEEQHKRAMSDYEKQVATARGAPPQTSIQHVSVPASATSVRAAAQSAIQDAIRRAQRASEDEFTSATRAIRTAAAEEHSARMLKLVEELAALEQERRRVVDADLQREATAFEQAELAAIQEAKSASNRASSGWAPPAAVVTVPQVVDGVTPAEVEGRLHAVKVEYKERELATRSDYETRIAASNASCTSARNATAALRVKLQQLQQQQQLLPHSAQQEVPSRSATPDPMPQGLPPRSTTPLQRQPSPNITSPVMMPSSGLAIAGNEAFAFLEEQQRGMAARQEMIAHARSEWQQDMHHHHQQATSTGGEPQVLQEVGQSLDEQENLLQRDLHSLRALERYYGQQGRTHQHHHHHVDPASQATTGPSTVINAQIVTALQKLNDKIERLASRVEHITVARSSSTAARRTAVSPSRGVPETHGHSKSQHRGRSDQRDDNKGGNSKHRSSSSELANKWGSILKNVASKSKSFSKVPPYEDAIRQYLHAE